MRILTHKLKTLTVFTRTNMYKHDIKNHLWPFRGFFDSPPQYVKKHMYRFKEPLSYSPEHWFVNWFNYFYFYFNQFIIQYSWLLPRGSLNIFFSSHWRRWSKNFRNSICDFWVMLVRICVFNVGKVLSYVYIHYHPRLSFQLGQICPFKV